MQDTGLVFALISDMPEDKLIPLASAFARQQS
jgi:hypothetical protein